MGTRKRQVAVGMTDWCCWRRVPFHDCHSLVEGHDVGRPQRSTVEGPRSDSSRANTTSQDGVGRVVTRPLRTHH